MDGKIYGMIADLSWQARHRLCEEFHVDNLWLAYECGVISREDILAAWEEDGERE